MKSAFDMTQFGIEVQGFILNSLPFIGLITLGGQDQSALFITRSVQNFNKNLKLPLSLSNESHSF